MRRFLRKNAILPRRIRCDQPRPRVAVASHARQHAKQNGGVIQQPVAEAHVMRITSVISAGRQSAGFAGNDRDGGG
jgi:hypothetical protein